MEDDIRSTLKRLEKAVSALADAVEARQMDIARFGLKKVILVCEHCGSAYKAGPDGMRCTGCGRRVPVTWPDGTVPTSDELRMIVLRLEARRDRPSDA